MKNKYEWNREHNTAVHTVFHVNVVRSIGQVDKMEFDKIGQHVMIITVISYKSKISNKRNALFLDVS